jgi:two-component system chemotaxis sensor kinase CheA
VRVKINKLDRLMNMVGELLINKTRLASLEIKKDGYGEIISQLDRVTMELHHTVMQIRMVPIGGVFNRFPRMIRDISKDIDKEVVLNISGEETELDRSIIDELSDPLTHLLRNAVDHGIEKAAVREKKGKDKVGSIYLRAYQKGSEIIIEVEDDGSGLDIDTIINKAKEKKIVIVDELEDMSKKDKLHLIFRPGFSTKEKVSDFSGRGGGMDVVKRTVEKELEGQIFIDTKKGKGTKFTISLPLTLAITEALMVQIGEEIFALPLSSVSETLMVETKDIKQVKGSDVIIRHDKTIPLIDSKESLNMKLDDSRNITEGDEIPVVIIETGDSEIGFIVDELLNQQEIVIKSISEYLDVEEISGATIIGDGEIALILDIRNIA